MRYSSIPIGSRCNDLVDARDWRLMSYILTGFWERTHSSAPRDRHKFKRENLTRQNMPNTNIKSRFVGSDSDLIMLVNVCAAFWSAVRFEGGILRVPMKAPHVQFARVRTLDPTHEYPMCDKNGDLVLMHFVPLKDGWVLYSRPHPVPMHLHGDIGCDADCEERVLFKQLCRHETMVSRLRNFIVSHYSTRTFGFSFVYFSILVSMTLSVLFLFVYAQC